MRHLKRNFKGITLISLVVTIVILLILAGVTLNSALSQNGLFKRAKTTLEKYNLESEREALNMSVVSYQTSKNFDEANQEEKLGETLYEKNLKNGDKWHVVTKDGITYDEGWNFVKKGSNIEGYGKAKYSWLINYETGEVIQLEEGKYNSITVKDTIAIRDNLIINIDSAMVDNNVQNNKDSIEKALGEGVELHNFDFQNDGLINNEFVFDGENDFILIDLKKINENNETLLENGFTFEFYGKIKKGKQLLFRKNVLGKEIDSNQYSPNTGIFQITQYDDTLYTEAQNSRVIAFFTEFEESLKKNFALYFPVGGNDEFDRYDGSDRTNWVKCYDIKDKESEYSYYTVSIMKNDDGKFTQSFFENGKLIKIGELNEICINFLSSLKKNFLAIGVAEEGYVDESGKAIGKVCLSQLNTKCLRLYNRGLTPDEIQENYNKTTSYHNLMESLKDKS